MTARSIIVTTPVEPTDELNDELLAVADQIWADAGLIKRPDIRVEQGSRSVEIELDGRQLPLGPAQWERGLAAGRGRHRGAAEYLASAGAFNKAIVSSSRDEARRLHGALLDEALRGDLLGLTGIEFDDVADRHGIEPTAREGLRLLLTWGVAPPALPPDVSRLLSSADDPVLAADRVLEALSDAGALRPELVVSERLLRSLTLGRETDTHDTPVTESGVTGSIFDELRREVQMESGIAVPGLALRLNTSPSSDSDVSYHYRFAGFATSRRIALPTDQSAFCDPQAADHLLIDPLVGGWVGVAGSSENGSVLPIPLVMLLRDFFATCRARLAWWPSTFETIEPDVADLDATLRQHCSQSFRALERLLASQGATARFPDPLIEGLTRALADGSTTVEAAADHCRMIMGANVLGGRQHQTTPLVIYIRENDDSDGPAPIEELIAKHPQLLAVNRFVVLAAPEGTGNAYREVLRPLRDQVVVCDVAELSGLA